MIAFSSAPLLWEFEDFVYLNESNPVEDWYSTQSDQVQNDFDTLLKDAHKIDQHRNWIGWRGYLQGEARELKIWEIGFKSEGKQYRVFGIFGPRRKAILLVGCYHKQKVYTPRDAIDTAIKRAKALARREAKTYARPICTDF